MVRAWYPENPRSLCCRHSATNSPGVVHLPRCGQTTKGNPGAHMCPAARTHPSPHPLPCGGHDVEGRTLYALRGCASSPQTHAHSCGHMVCAQARRGGRDAPGSGPTSRRWGNEARVALGYAPGDPHRQCDGSDGAPLTDTHGHTDTRTQRHIHRLLGYQNHMPPSPPPSELPVKSTPTTCTTLFTNRYSMPKTRRTRGNPMRQCECGSKGTASHHFSRGP
jgi:hypothetical protein